MRSRHEQSQQTSSHTLALTAPRTQVPPSQQSVALRHQIHLLRSVLTGTDWGLAVPLYWGRKYLTIMTLGKYQMGLVYVEYNSGEKKVSNMFLERKLSSNNLSCGWPLLLAMTVKVTHLLLFFLEAPPESCQPPIPHSRPWLPAGSQAEGHQQAPWARALGMVCSAHILGWFHTYWAVFEWCFGQVPKCLCRWPCPGSLALAHVCSS